MRWLYGLDFSDPAWLAAVIVGAAAITLVIIVLFPLVLLAVEAAFAVLAAFLVLRPWRVVAESDDERFEWHVRGWRRSRTWMKEIAGQISRGDRIVSPPTV